MSMTWLRAERRRGYRVVMFACAAGLFLMALMAISAVALLGQVWEQTETNLHLTCHNHEKLYGKGNTDAVCDPYLETPIVKTTRRAP